MLKFRSYTVHRSLTCSSRKMRYPTYRQRLGAILDCYQRRPQWARALLQTGKAEQAIPLLEKSLAVDQDGSIHFQLFRAYQLTSRNAQAQQAHAEYERLRKSLAAAH